MERAIEPVSQTIENLETRLSNSYDLELNEMPIQIELLHLTEIGQKSISSSVCDQSSWTSQSNKARSKRETDSSKKKQAFSILIKHVKKRWTNHIKIAYNKVSERWKERGLIRNRVRFKKSKKLVEHVMGVLFFPSLCNQFAKMEERMNSIFAYADTFCSKYMNLLYYVHHFRDGRTVVDCKLLDELVKYVQDYPTLITEFHEQKRKKPLQVKHNVSGRWSSSNSSESKCGELGSNRRESGCPTSKQIPSRERLSEGFCLLQEELVEKQRAVQRAVKELERGDSQIP